MPEIFFFFLEFNPTKHTYAPLTFSLSIAVVSSEKEEGQSCTLDVKFCD